MKAAIIDLDGTILDSLGMWSKIDREFLEVRRGIAVPEDYVKIIAPMTYRETADYTIARFGFSQSPQELMAEWDEMAMNEYKTGVQLKPHAKEFLVRLKERNIPAVLCTSSPESYYLPALTRLGVYELFDSFVTTTEVGVSKHFPDVYLLAAEKIGVRPEECMAFEDIPDAVLGAKKAGMQTCGVYDPRSAEEVEYMKQICDHYVMDLQEFLNQI